jgi:hypothetical protein
MAYPGETQIIRGFVPSTILAALKDFIEDAYRKVDKQFSEGTPHPDFAVTRSWDGLHVPYLKKHFDGATPIADFQRHVTQYFTGGRMIDDECTIRRHRGAVTHLGWHTDADAAGSAQFDPCFNIWVPLASVGTALPSLEVIPKSDPKMRCVAFTTNSSKTIPDDWRKDAFPGVEPLCPKLSPGDVLVFSHYVLHRTQRLMCPFRNFLKSRGKLCCRQSRYEAGAEQCDSVLRF